MIHGSMRHYASGRKKKYNAWSTKKREYEFKELERTSQTFRRDTPNYPSREDTGCSTGRVCSPKYTGTLVKGISTMHKSNAVPIINEEEAKEHASMRR
jgi:hypothetical protein